MDVQSTIDALGPVETVVLLGVVCRGAESDEPARLDEVRTTCNQRLNELTGRLSEADVTRALNRLEDDGLVELRRPDDSSPVGKGRPTCALAVDPDDVLEALRGDDRVEPLIEVVGETMD